MENLRLILIVIGLAVLGAIWLLHRPEGSARKPGASRREEGRRDESPPGKGRSEENRPGENRKEPFIGDAVGEQQDDTGSPGNAAAGDEDSAEPQQTTLPDLGDELPDDTRDARKRPPSESIITPRSAARDVPPEREWRESEPVRKVADVEAVSAERDGAVAPKIVTLYIRARSDRHISGLSLLDAAIKAGLRFGEMKIFHRRHRGAAKPVFSMANITRPGSFDPSGWNLFQTPGVTLFMTLPGPVSALDAWDAMLATGKRLSELLDADLMDDAQCLLTRQRTAQIREDMREFDRRNGLQS